MSTGDCPNRIACDGMPDVKFSIVVDSPDGKTIKLDLQN